MICAKKAYICQVVLPQVSANYLARDLSEQKAKDTITTDITTITFATTTNNNNWGKRSYH